MSLQDVLMIVLAVVGFPLLCWLRNRAWRQVLRDAGLACRRCGGTGEDPEPKPVGPAEEAR
jgi:hypothetical protein